MNCECGCGLEVKLGRRFINGHNRKGMKDSKETIQKKKKNCGKYIRTEEIKNKITGEGNGMFRKTHTDENKELFRQQNYVRFSNVEERYRIGDSVRQHYIDYPVKKIIKSILMIGNISSRDKEYNPSNNMNIQERDKGICQNPACFNPSKSIDVHHIDKNRNNNRLENLITLCRKCHRKVHKIMENSL